MTKLDLSNPMPLMQSIQRVLQKNIDTTDKLTEVMHELSMFFKSDLAVSYISIDDNYLELFSAYGIPLSDEMTSIRFGDGLIGEIALKEQVLSQTLKDAPLSSIIGAPLIQWDKVTGVVLLGYVKPHIFDDLEIDALKTIAMF